MNSERVVLRRYPATIHAELAKGAREASGIDLFIEQGLPSRQYEVPGREIALMVKAADAEQARAILGREEQFSS